MNRAFTRTSIVFAVGFSLLITSCSDSNPGEPRPATTTTVAAGTPTSSTADSTENALSDVKPCELLTSAEATGLGYSEAGEADEIAGDEACTWAASGNGNLIIGINLRQGIEDLNYNGARTSPASIGKYEATVAEEPSNGKGICHVVIGFSGSSSIQVARSLKSTSTDTAAACERATEAAELIAAKLP